MTSTLKLTPIGGRFPITIILSLASVTLSCTPSIHLIDRQTVMETDASGEWPDTDERSFYTNFTSKPARLPNTPNKDKKDKDDKNLSILSPDQ